MDASGKSSRRLLEAKVYEGERFTYGQTQDISVALSRALAKVFGVERGLDITGHLENQCIGRFLRGHCREKLPRALASLSD